MTDERQLLTRTVAIASDYLDTLDSRPIRPDRTYQEMLAVLDAPLPDGPADPLAVVEELAAAVEPGLCAMGSGRYFGFVIGGALLASLATDWLVSAWDQEHRPGRPDAGDVDVDVDVDQTIAAFTAARANSRA